MDQYITLTCDDPSPVSALVERTGGTHTADDKDDKRDHTDGGEQCAHNHTPVVIINRTLFYFYKVV